MTRGLAGVVILGMIGLAGWWLAGDPDPFRELDNEDYHSEHSSHEVEGAASDRPPTDRLRQIDQLLDQDPYNTTLISEKVHLGLEHQPQAAVEECRRILSESPDNYFALHHAALAYLQMTNVDRALHYAARALDVRDTAEAQFVAGHVFFAKGDFRTALGHYQAVLALHPENEDAKRFVERTENALTDGP